MKQKNILLIVFFLTLFVFQQVQAGAAVPSMGNPSQIRAAPANANILFSTVQVYVYKLVDGSGAIQSPPQLCVWPQDFGVYGCGNDYVGSLDPEGFLHVGVEQDYLRDVLATEMNLAQITPDPEGEALKAQAIASRSVASWKSAHGPWDDGNGESDGVWPRINNSNTYQVFVPGAHNTSDYKSAIDAAVDGTTGQFLQYVIGDNNVIDASFGADMGSATVDGDVSAPYLKGIQDPISVGCVLNLGNAQYGMSQRGAIRWAKGNVCPDGSGAAWPVKWNHQQILVHYYTGVDIVNDANGSKIAPDDRWNLLWHNNFGYQAGVRPELQSDLPYTLQVRFQNTSVDLWTESSIEIGYRWYQNGQPIDSEWHVIGGNLPEISAGGEYPTISPLADPLTVANIVAPSSEGYYTLHLDLRRNGHWLSEQNPAWPDATIDVHVNGPTATATSAPTQPSTATATATPVATPGIKINYLDAHGEAGQYTSFTGSTIPAVDVYADDLYAHMNLSGVGLPDGDASQAVLIAGIYNDSSVTRTVYYNAYYSASGAGSLFHPTPCDTLGVCSGVLSSPITFTGSLAVGPYQTIYNDWGVRQNGYISLGTEYSYYASVHFSLAPVDTAFTPTPQPTATPTNCCIAECLNNESNGTSSSSDLKTLFHTVSYLQQALFDLQLLYRVRDEILSQTPLGQHYIDLYYGQGIEITDILRNNSELKNEAIATLQHWEPKLQALVDGQGDTVFISQEEVNAIEHFLSGLEAVASDDLRTVIQNERADLNMQGLVGLTMSQAWEEMNGIATATPTPTSTSTPTNTPTNAPTNTPTPTDTPTLTPTDTPTNTPTSTPSFTPTSTPTDTPTHTPTSTPTQPIQPLYLSLNNVATVGGVTTQDIDILYFNGTTWGIFFDASDVGIDTSGQDLNEFHILDADTLLMAFDDPMTLGTLTVDPWDVVRFDATSLGNNTAGTFSMYLDGNDVGLDTTNEYIDGLHVLPDGRVLISTTGSPTVPGVTGIADEDILAFTPNTLGDVTSGTWSIYFDGSDVGLADSSDEDVDALAVHSNGDIYLSTSGNFAVTGVAGFDEDVFICTPTSFGTVTACTYSPSLYFDGSAWGVDATDVDGINLTLP